MNNNPTNNNLVVPHVVVLGHSDAPSAHRYHTNSTGKGSIEIGYSSRGTKIILTVLKGEDPNAVWSISFKEDIENTYFFSGGMAHFLIHTPTNKEYPGLTVTAKKLGSSVPPYLECLWTPV
jgi:hypothetical protein